MKNKITAIILSIVVIMSTVSAPLFAQSWGNLTDAQKEAVFEVMAQQIKTRLDLAERATTKPMVAGATIGPRISAAVVNALSNYFNSSCNNNNLCESIIGENEINCPNDCYKNNIYVPRPPQGSTSQENDHTPVKPVTGPATAITATTVILEGFYSPDCADCGKDIDDDLVVGFYIQNTRSSVASGQPPLGAQWNSEQLKASGRMVTGTFFRGVRDEKNKGRFYAKIIGLEPNARYAYRAVVKYKSRQIFADEVKYFNTPSQFEQKSSTGDEKCGCAVSYSPVCYELTSYATSTGITTSSKSYINSCVATCEQKKLEEAFRSSTRTALSPWKRILYRGNGPCNSQDAESLYKQAQDATIKQQDERKKAQEEKDTSATKIIASLDSVGQADNNCLIKIKYEVKWTNEEILFVFPWMYEKGNKPSQFDIKKTFLSIVTIDPYDSEKVDLKGFAGSWLRRKYASFDFIERRIGAGRETCWMIVGWDKDAKTFAFSNEFCVKCEAKTSDQPSGQTSGNSACSVKDGKIYCAEVSVPTTPGYSVTAKGTTNTNIISKRIPAIFALYPEDLAEDRADLNAVITDVGTISGEDQVYAGLVYWKQKNPSFSPYYNNDAVDDNSKSYLEPIESIDVETQSTGSLNKSIKVVVLGLESDVNYCYQAVIWHGDKGGATWKTARRNEVKSNIMCFVPKKQLLITSSPVINDKVKVDLSVSDKTTCTSTLITAKVKCASFPQPTFFARQVVPTSTRCKGEIKFAVDYPNGFQEYQSYHGVKAMSNTFDLAPGETHESIFNVSLLPNIYQPHGDSIGIEVSGEGFEDISQEKKIVFPVCGQIAPPIKPRCKMLMISGLNSTDREIVDCEMAKCCFQSVSATYDKICYTGDGLKLLMSTFERLGLKPPPACSAEEDDGSNEQDDISKMIGSMKGMCVTTGYKALIVPVTNISLDELKKSLSSGVNYYITGPINSEGGCGKVKCYATSDYKPVKGYVAAKNVRTDLSESLLMIFSNAGVASCYNASYVTTISEDNNESAGLSVITNPSPAAGTKIFRGVSDIAVAAWKVTALDKDLSLQKVILNFESKIWESLAEISLWSGDDELQSIANLGEDSFKKISSTTYELVFDKVNLSLPKGVTKILTVKVTSRQVFTDDNADRQVVVILPINGIIAVDSSQTQYYGPSESLSRSFTPTNPISAMVSAGLTDNNNVQSVRVKATDVTPNNLVGEFYIKSNNAGSKIDSITVEFNQTEEIITALRLWDGSTELTNKIVSGKTGQVEFSNLGLTIAKDTTKVLKITADAKTVNSSQIGSSFDWSVVKINGADENNSVWQSPTAFEGKTTYFFLSYPTFTFDSAPVSVTPKATGINGYATAKIRLSIKANHGRIYISKNADGMTNITNIGTATSKGFWSISCQTDAAQNNADYYIIDDGQTIQCSIDTVVTPGPIGGNYQVSLNHIKWQADNTDAKVITQTWPNLASTFKTAVFYMEGNGNVSQQTSPYMSETKKKTVKLIEVSTMDPIANDKYLMRGVVQFGSESSADTLFKVVIRRLDSSTAPIVTQYYNSRRIQKGDSDMTFSYRLPEPSYKSVIYYYAIVKVGNNYKYGSPKVITTP